MIDPAESIEIRAAEANGDFTEQIAGGPEVGREAIEAVKSDLTELPNDLRRAFESVDPGLGDAIVSRSEGVRGYLMMQLDGSDGTVGVSALGNEDNETSVSGNLKQMSFGEVSRIVGELKMLAATLAQEVKGQQGDAKTIDLSKLNTGDSHAVGMFWQILTENANFKPGDTAEVAGHRITASESQGKGGMGSESPQVEITKVDDEEQAEGELQPVDNQAKIDEARDNIRHMPDRRYETNSERPAA